jgi:hypothetical protein
MGRVDSDSEPSGQTSAAETAAGRVSDRNGTSQLMGPQTETLDRLLGRTETELCAAKTRESWSLFAILRAAYRARTSDPKR